MRESFAKHPVARSPSRRQVPVIPAQAGIHSPLAYSAIAGDSALYSRLRGNDGKV